MKSKYVNKEFQASVCDVRAEIIKMLSNSFKHTYYMSKDYFEHFEILTRTTVRVMTRVQWLDVMWLLMSWRLYVANFIDLWCLVLKISLITCFHSQNTKWRLDDVTVDWSMSKPSLPYSNWAWRYCENFRKIGSLVVVVLTPLIQFCDHDDVIKSTGRGLNLNGKCISYKILKFGGKWTKNKRDTHEWIQNL